MINLHSVLATSRWGLASLCVMDLDHYFSQPELSALIEQLSFVK